MSSKCAVIEVAPPARSRSIDFRTAAAASSRDVGSIENPEISAGPNRTVPMIRPSLLTEKWDRCSSGGSARYRSRWTLRSLVGRSVRPETKVCQYAWASVVCKGSRLNGTAPARGSRNIKLRPRRFYAEGGPSTRCMDFGLTEIQEITRKTVRDFAEQQIIPQSRAFDESQEFPHAWAKKMGELGLFGVFVPEKYGGAGLDTVCYAITIEDLSRGDASAGVIAAVCNGLVCEPLLRYGNEEQKRRFLEPVARGEWMGAYALTEPGSGSDAAAMRTTATLERDEWVLRGTKTFATNGSVAKIVVVYARKYAKERQAFGQKIAEFQAIQWKLADMATEIDAARLLTYRAAHLEDRGQRHTYESSVAKLFASEAAHRAVDAAVQIHGGYGFIKDYVVEKLYRDQRGSEIYEGTSEGQPPGIPASNFRG